MSMAAASLYVEPEEDDIPVLDHIVLALGADHALLPSGGHGTHGHQVVEGDDFSPDKAPLKVGVDLAGGLGSLGAGGNGPGPALVLAAGEVGDKAQEGNEYLKKVRALAEAEGSEVLPICAKLEQDIAELEGEEKLMFLEELGVEESGLDRLIKCSYALLGLISFLTYGKDECRAWTIKKGTKAPQAAGKIHSDIERGFIRAEVIAYDDMIACGSVNAAKEKGLLRSEGKEYVVQDGDMVYFRFNV